MYWLHNVAATCPFALFRNSSKIKCKNFAIVDEISKINNVEIVKTMNGFEYNSTIWIPHCDTIEV